MFTSEDDSYVSSSTTTQQINTPQVVCSERSFEVSAGFAALGTEDDEHRKRLVVTLVEKVKDELKGANAAEFMSQYGTTLVALAHECPFADIRAAFSPLVSVVRAPPPTTFLDPDNASVPLDTKDETARVLYIHAFQQFGFVPNYLRVMALNMKHTLTHYDAFMYTLLGDTPLPATWRYYIMIMAAATQRCDYFLRFGIRQFLNVGGDVTWLQGVNQAHPKLQALTRMLDVLAHAPWELCNEDMASLIAKRWSNEELLHALILGSTVQCLCSFVLSTGISVDLTLSAEMPGIPYDFEKFYLLPPHTPMRYTDFDNRRGFSDGPRNRVYHYLLTTEFAWESHALPIFQEFLPSQAITQFLGTEFGLFEEVQHQSVVLRTLTIHLFDLYGVKSDDFNYHELNKILMGSMSKDCVIAMKSFLKKAGTSPHVVVQDDLTFGNEMTPKDKVEFAHIVHVARKKMLMIYVARAMHR
eukprot:PhF_6_TR11225/c0_g1_i1/m.18101/K10141/SESN1_3; sestrin 1/3